MLAPGGYQRASRLKKIHHFHHQGDHCYFTPYNYGTEPHLLSFGNNVHIASGVRFVTHDISAMMFHTLDPDTVYSNRVGTISVGNDVFIGANATILYDVCIGDRVIVAAGALVNKNLASDGVYAGVPARRIGDFEEYRKKILAASTQYPWTDEDSVKERRRKQEEFFFPHDMQEDE